MNPTHNGRSDSNRQASLPPSMVERITVIMDAFTHPSVNLSLEEVTRRSSLPRSTVHRILEQLALFGWVSHAGDVYRLGHRAFSLGARQIVCDELRSASNTRLNELAYRTGLVVHLAALDGTEIYYLDKFGGPGATKVPSRVGGRAPAHCTAGGKAILAYLPPESVHEHYSELSAARTGRSIAGINALHQELAAIRARGGVSFERGECFPQIACVGMSIRDKWGPIAAISVVAGVDAPIDQLVPLVVTTAKAISRDVARSEDMLPSVAFGIGAEAV